MKSLPIGEVIKEIADKTINAKKARDAAKKARESIRAKEKKRKKKKCFFILADFGI